MESGWSLVAEQLVELRNRLSIARERERWWLRLVALLMDCGVTQPDSGPEIGRLLADLGATDADLRRALEEK